MAIFRSGGKDAFLHLAAGLALLGAQPDRAAPHSVRSEDHGGSGGHLLASSNSAGGEHGQWRIRVDDLRPQDHRGHIAAMCAGFHALSDE
jgi:hypothetical protein